MAKIIVEGKTRLSGTIGAAGNKNAALPIIAATVLTSEECILENVPQIRDVEVMLSLLEYLGKRVNRTGEGVVEIHGELQKTQLTVPQVSELRASILYLGAVLAQAGEVAMGPPGGCVIGRRGLESHFDALQSFQATVHIDPQQYVLSLRQKSPAHLFLKEASVTATENALFLAASTPGKSVIENAACEPHITDLAVVLEKMGARIFGKGTNRLEVEGTNSLGGFRHRIVPDHIEAGTFAILAACTGSELTIEEVIPAHLQMPLYYFDLFGLRYQIEDDSRLHVFPSDLKAPGQKIQTGLYPGFPTDLMSPMIVLATQAEGVTLCHDWLYESRMFFTDKLIAMGAQITLCDPHRVIVTGPTALKGQHLSTPDIRAGIALVIAALSASGSSVIDKAELINRGYENIVPRLQNLGARISWQET